MSILVPLVSSGITMNEIPGRIAVYFELGNCTQGCPECHSPHLSEQQVLAITPLEELESIAETQTTKGADAIVLMGGTTNGISDDDLITICQTLGSILPLGLYSGRDDEERDKEIARRGSLQWLKTGSYQEELGGLDSPRTNQRFYELEARFVFDRSGLYRQTDTIFHDLTHLFQKGVP
jgi:anaerobic ribonucleoside-triphosphate reductase activating protein